MEFLVTTYTLLNVLFAMYLVVMICLSNVLPRRMYKWMIVFFPATIIIGLVGWISYTFQFYFGKDK